MSSASPVDEPAPMQRRRHRVLLVGLGLVVIASFGLAVKTIWLTDSSRPISVDEAVDQYRTETTQTAPAPTTAAPDIAPSALPEPGVYRYLTSGGESIDAMGGVERTYPAETTITVTPHGCGVRLEWVALDERREQWGLCLTDDGVTLQPDGAQIHEFFGRRQLDEVRCDETVELIATSALPGSPVDRSCSLADDPWTPRWTVVERSTRQVDGTEMDVTHVRMTVDDTDEYWEDTTVDWYLDASGLPVYVRAETTSRSPSMVGAVVYEESYELELESLTPMT